MTPAPIAVGALAFVGPAHIPGLTEFHYVRVTSVSGDLAHVALIDPDAADEVLSEEIETALLKRRAVSDDESALWPGTYVGHPIAFIQPDGPEMYLWAFGLVSGYSMTGAMPWLHVRHAGGNCKVALHQLTNVIKIDWISYALQPAVGKNAAVINAVELLEEMDDIIGACTKNRGIPAKVKNALTIPYEPDELVEFIRPDTLVLVSVPRQHVVDCSLKKKAKRGTSMFSPPTGSDDPTIAKTKKRKAAPASVGRKSTRQKLVHDSPSDESEAESVPPTATDDDDIRAPGQPVSARPTCSRGSEQYSDLYDGSRGGAPLGNNVPTDCPGATINNAISHPDNQGKDAQCILEFAQQAREHTFRRTPPVLRGAYDFGFHVRGLSVTHFAQFTPTMMLEAVSGSVNMIDFSRKNCLQPALASPTYADLLESLRNLRNFGRTFYNNETVGVLEAAVAFVEAFGEGQLPDHETTRRLVLWIDMKLWRFRGLILSCGLSAALRVKDEFSLHDSMLSKLLYDQQQSKIAGLLAQLEARPTSGSAGRSDSRGQRPEKRSGIPTSVLRSLPKKGSLDLCIKYISKAGCTGNGTSGQCFSSKRTHFRPKKIPANLKEYVEKTYGGLAPEFTGL
ncbi:hypothetical protein PF005_g9211 [Phytophthora fragariae]|uniref:Uncharacterized protein n=1 Tax=Phytophthora fragariae TaxID=53985 RepID=A0A6A3U534_9STRA|nr:hypothetical protein PF003_g18595 [Phytophthora fragariae]KAE9146647.1 hypothetical protein PF006_g8593 [Phytophthora fragariae]KAE9216005.1 hypothetical protein PF005_g9211 [Phytophthora fragariae]KAE9239952.1 hypothetical protein PF002_g10008 [Phytophthora fragariae]KAE9313931.1 hypothetical protein PF001_g8504 [Phytophthora fragariae]